MAMTSSELEQFKQDILDSVRVMMQTTGQVTQYIGARYVPLFAEPMDWSDQIEYEPLTIVTYQGNSFTSRQFVPKGIGIDNADFWASTGNYNAQIEQYRQEVAALSGKIDTFDERITANANEIAVNKSSIENLKNQFVQIIEGGCIRERMFISFIAKKEGGFQGLQNAVYFTHGGIEHIIMQTVDSFNNNSQELIDFNLNNESVVETVKSWSNFHGSSIWYDGNILVYDNNSKTVVTVNPDDYTDISTTGVSTNYMGITYSDRDSKLLGVIENGPNFEVWSLNGDFSQNEKLIIVPYIDGSQTVSCYDGKLYFTSINAITVVDIDTGVGSQYTSSLGSKGEYESCVVIDGEICPCVFYGNVDNSLAVFKSGIGGFGGINSSKTGSYTNNTTIYVNESATGFFETGVDKTKPCHSGMVASGFASSFNYDTIYILGDTHANINAYNAHLKINGEINSSPSITLNYAQNSFISSDNIKTVIQNTPNSEYDSGNSANIRNCFLSLSDASFTTNAGYVAIDGCVIVCKGNWAFEAPFVIDTSKLLLSSTRSKKQMPLYNGAPISSGATFTSTITNNTTIQNLIMGRLVCVEVEYNDVTYGAVGCSSAVHPSTVLATGCSDTGEPVLVSVVLTAGDNKSKVNACKVGNNNANMVSMYVVG